ncbi:catalase [Exidia glandulosa HHB12029]|uniref:Catalase n=1 Tax=Exidia glandulosa HHB12029 TaxID=1314781 RepID=A0A165I411_EXIGL|nr:catalase [Exidia glandulosa HHB12029]
MEQVAASIKRSVQGVVLDGKSAQLLHSTVDPNEAASGKVITTMHGTRVANTDTWLKAADAQFGGPALLEDHVALEKIHRFDHERIPERVVHARGAGAHGYFRVFDNSAAQYTAAKVLNDPSRKTPVFVRFSTVQGPRGSADTVRDVRGFAIKFYTEEGNWDLVGNNIPVFFIQEAMKFPDFVHAVKPEPHNEVPTGQSAHDNFWDYYSLETETSHMIQWAMSDRAIPRSYRMMQGFGVNTYTLINDKNERHFVKFHLTPELGVHSLMWDEALKIAGQDPDFHRKDLNEAIDNGAYPAWSFGIQVLPESRQDEFDFDILDATKLWPEDIVPVKYIGELVLNRTVDEYFPETEQVAFCTSHVVPGIGFSDDPLLQGRMFSYLDTQLSRLGTNWEELPINRPVCPVMNHIRDGQHRQTITKGKVNYWPNRFEHAPPATAEQGGYVEHPQKIMAAIKQRVRAPKFQEHLNQATMFFNSLSPIEQLHTVNAMAFELSHVEEEQVRTAAIARINQVDHTLAKLVAGKVGVDLPAKPFRENHGLKAKNLSQFAFAPKVPSIKSRRIAILVADGFDEPVVMALKAAITASSALAFVVGPRSGLIKNMTGTGGVKADHHYEGQRSTLFDAVVIPPGAAAAAAMAQDGRVVHWVREAFGHAKAIGAIGEGVAFVREALGVPGLQYASPSAPDEVVVSYGIVTARAYTTTWAAADIGIGPEKKGFFSKFAFELSKHRCFERELDGLTGKVAF